VSRSLLSLVLLAAMPVSGIAAGPRPSDAPHVVLITLDTTRADRLGAYGWAAARTPALDRLAADGVVFEEAYTSAPMTLPAHATMLTGLEPAGHGLRVNGQGSLGENVPVVTERLARMGYRTGAFVAAFVLDRQFGLARGFDIYDDDLSAAEPQVVREQLSVSRRGDRVMDAALRWFDIVAQPAGPPVFLWVHLYDAHWPHDVHPELADGPFAGVASYDGDIAFADLQVGRLLADLAARGMAERTVVIVAGDHGEGLQDHGEIEHGYTLTRESLHVPLIIRWPGRIAAGRRVSAVVSLADITPTVLDLVGGEPLPVATGHTLAAALRGEPTGSRPSYAETDLPYTSYRWSPLRSVTTERWKYVRTAKPELYDRASDPDEHHNVASARPLRVAKLERLLSAHEARVGRVAAPTGAIAAGGVDVDARRRLESLGYVLPTAAAPATSISGLQDIKDMLPVKHLEAYLTQGLAEHRIMPEDAVAVAGELVARSPETPVFHHDLGAVLVDAGRPDEAVSELETAVRLQSDFPEARALLAGLLGAAGRTDDAAAQYEFLLGSDPKNLDLHRDLARLYLAAGRRDEAVARYAAALEVAPGAATLHHELGRALLDGGDLDGAAVRLERAVALDPRLAQAQYDLGRLRLARGDATGAAAAWHSAIMADPTAAAAYARLGRLDADTGKDAEAIRMLRTAVRLEPSEPRNRVWLAWVLISDGASARRTERALALAHDALAQEPNHPEVLEGFAAALVASGETAYGVAAARRALAFAEAAGDASLASRLRSRLPIYEHGQVPPPPWRAATS